MVRPIGAGGQGRVFEVAHSPIRPGANEPNRALKQFRFGSGQRGKEAKDRFRREVAALRELRDPAILRLVDANGKDGWMVTELYPTTLAETIKSGYYTGRPLEALLALRPLVAALARLHEKGIVHRDIKPANIFVDTTGQLVLGDFGIVFFKDDKGERLTETFERVGSRDWIAPWVDVRARKADVRPTADVFPLGKVLWTMIAGDETLPFWYYAKPPYNLEARFPNDPDMRWITEILAASVVENESDCLPSGKDLLARIDVAIGALQRGGSVLREGEPWPCRVCGVGQYKALFGGEARVIAVPDALSGSTRAVTVGTCPCSGTVASVVGRLAGERVPRSRRDAEPRGAD